MVVENSGNLRQRLETYLDRISKGIENQVIQTEAELCELFRVNSDQQLAMWSLRGIHRSEGTDTLLEILGYSADDVEDHPAKRTVIGQIGYSPDYILMCSKRPLSVVDLKAPGQDLDRDRWTAQVRSYCRELKVPLGILFSGSDIRVLLNTDHSGLTKHQGQFATEAVAAASLADRKELVALLAKLAFPALSGNPVAIANAFARKRSAEIRNRARQRTIQECLRNALDHPTAPVFAALANVHEIWEALEPRPSEGEIATAWSQEQLKASKPVRRRS
jgi:hypothetical protein